MSDDTIQRGEVQPVTVETSTERRPNVFIVEYRLRSTVDEPVTVVVTDRIPTSGVEKLGFHDSQRPSDWTANEGDLEFQVALEPAATRTLALGIVPASNATVEYEPSVPTVSVVDSSSDGRHDGTPEGGGPDPGPPATNGAGDGVAVDGASTDDAWTDRMQLDGDAALDMPDDSAETSVSDAGGADDSGDVRTAAKTDGGRVAAALAAELEAGAVTDEEQAVLEEHFGVELTNGESVRLEYVQNRLADFDAYVDAMEELLAVHGTGEDAIASLHGRLDDLAADVEAIGERQAATTDRLDDIADGLAARDDRLDSIRTTHEVDVRAVRADMERLEDAVDDVRTSLEAEIASVEAEVDSFETMRRSLRDSLRRTGDLAGAGRESAETDLDPDDGDEAVAHPPASTGRPVTNRSGAESADETNEAPTTADDGERETRESDDDEWFGDARSNGDSDPETTTLDDDSAVTDGSHSDGVGTTVRDRRDGAPTIDLEDD